MDNGASNKESLAELWSNFLEQESQAGHDAAAKAGTKDQQNPEQITALYQTVCTEYLVCFYGSGHHDSTPGGRAGDISVVHLDSILCRYPLTWLN